MTQKAVSNFSPPAPPTPPAVFSTTVAIPIISEDVDVEGSLPETLRSARASANEELAVICQQAQVLRAEISDYENTPAPRLTSSQLIAASKFPIREFECTVAELQVLEKIWQLHRKYKFEIQKLAEQKRVAYENVVVLVRRALAGIGYADTTDVMDPTRILPPFLFKHPSVRAALGQMETMRGNYAAPFPYSDRIEFLNKRADELKRKI